MTVKFATAARLLLLPLALLLGVPEAWAQCTTTLASGSFLANGSWSASPSFTADGAGTVTLTVTGGAGGQSNMTVDHDGRQRRFGERDQSRLGVAVGRCRHT